MGAELDAINELVKRIMACEKIKDAHFIACLFKARYEKKTDDEMDKMAADFGQ